jgi:hypothetical protein
VAYTYGVGGSPAEPYTQETKLDAAGSPTAEWTQTYTDAFGRARKTVKGSVPAIGQ